MKISDNAIIAPLESKRAYQKIGLLLRQDIIDGRYQIGDKLPPERDIALQLNVSRTVIREAIIMLELENLVEVKKSSGVYVLKTPNSLTNQENIIADEVGPFEGLQARQLLESNIAEFAATQVTPADIAKMRAALALERQEIAMDSEENNGDKQFHICIAEATQNSLLADTSKQFWVRCEQSPMWKKLHSHIIGHGYREEWVEDHARILAAIQKRDPLASKIAMWQHLENVKQRLLELSDVDDPNFDGYLFNSNPLQLINEEK